MFTFTLHHFHLDNFSMIMKIIFRVQVVAVGAAIKVYIFNIILVVDSADVPRIQQPEIIEQIVKSPPEPTRVKSPEQIVIMRSPDPVFWTVPLDTGKTFTVTQNVREGDVANIVRPHSEIKVSTPSEPPARLLPSDHPSSAPPELWEQECKFPNELFRNSGD